MFFLFLFFALFTPDSSTEVESCIPDSLPMFAVNVFRALGVALLLCTARRLRRKLHIHGSTLSPAKHSKKHTVPPTRDVDGLHDTVGTEWMHTMNTEYITVLPCSEQYSTFHRKSKIQQYDSSSTIMYISQYISLAPAGPPCLVQNKLDPPLFPGSFAVPWRKPLQ